MYRVKPILGFVTVAAFLVAVIVGGVDAASLKGKKLLVDTVFNMVDDNHADKANEGVTTIAPSMAGDTIKVELFIEDGAAVASGPDKTIIGVNVVFGGSNEAMMFDNSWQVVGVDGILKLISPRALTDSSFALGDTGGAEITANGYLATVKILAKEDIADGASLYAKSAIVGTAPTYDLDELNTSDATVTFEAPTGPTITTDPAMGGNMYQIPAMGGNASVTIGLDNLPDDASISYTVTTTGDGSLSVLDMDGMMLDLDDQMMVSADQIVLKVTGGSLQVTVKATVNGEDTAAETLTFTQLNPAELASFDGALQTDSVVLNWSTVSQTNNAGWRIMRSVDGETFEAVGNFVQGAGTSDALMNYSFEDKDLPGVDKVYYRLEQVDLDGSIAQSNVIEVLLGARMPLPTEFAVNVYPNPFNPSTTISYDLPEGGPVTVVIYDVLGQQVRNLVSQVTSAGRYSIQWDARDNHGRGVASGVYIAKVDAGTSTLSQKMLLLK